MICDRCGEIGETFMTEQYGELCEACQKEVEEQNKAQTGRRRSSPAED